MGDKIKVRKGKDGYSYPYTSPDLVIDKDGKSSTTKFNELDSKTIILEKDNTSLKGIKDTTYDNLTTNDKTIIGGINEVTSQIKDIANEKFTTTNDIYQNIKHIKSIYYVDECIITFVDDDGKVNF